MKIAILFICTGKYSQFFPGFYDSAKKYFLKGIAKVDYYVFTDDKKLEHDNDVHIIYKECEGFPLDSLFRFKTCLLVEEELKNYDYVYFFNGNTLFLEDVGLEIIPTSHTLVVEEWSRRKPFKHPLFFPYERNKKSTAYVAPFGKGKYRYYMAGVYGGAPDLFLDLCHTLSENIQKDYDQGIVAVCHDESHINSYFRNHPCQLLPTNFCVPEEWSKTCNEYKAIFRNKVSLDKYFDKGRDHSLLGQIKKGINVSWNAVRWFF